MTVHEITRSPFVIAEVGSNWLSLDDCIVSVQRAAEAGANAVKFQLYDWKCMYGVGEPSEAFLRTCLPKEWLPILKQKADQASIEFMCTAFSPEYARYVNRFVNIHKIASSDLNYMELIHIVASFGKPMIISTGGHTKNDIGYTIGALQQYDRNVEGSHDPKDLASPIGPILMHCVSAYPTKDANLYRIKWLQNTFHRPVGFSDHTTDVTTIPVVAVHNCSARVIEKHMKIRAKMDTPDSPHSILPEDFKLMVHRIKNPYEFTQDSTPEEADMALMHNRRLVITKDLEVGDQLELGVNFDVLRVREPDKIGAHPIGVDMVPGMRTLVKMRRGEPLNVANLERLSHDEYMDRQEKAQQAKKRSQKVLQVSEPGEQLNGRAGADSQIPVSHA